MPRKRKSKIYERSRDIGRREEEQDRRRYFSTTEGGDRGDAKRVRNNDYEKTRINKSSLNKDQDSGPSYCYRAPYDKYSDAQEKVSPEKDSEAVGEILKTDTFFQTI